MFISTTELKNMNNELKNACKTGDLDTVKLLVARGADKLGDGMRYACENNHIDIVRWLLDCKYLSMDQAFSYVCIAGKVEMVKLMIDKKEYLNWDAGLYHAYVNGNTEIVHLLTLKTGEMLEYYPFSDEELYFFYKSGVTPSNRYKSYFENLQAIDIQARQVYEHVLITDLSNVVDSY